MSHRPLPAASRQARPPLRRALARGAFKLLPLLLPLPLLAGLSACVVAPPGYYRGGAPPRAAYIEPSYPSPGPDWAWEAHPAYGWGWHHPRRGWHRGWDRDPR